MNETFDPPDPHTVYTLRLLLPDDLPAFQALWAEAPIRLETARINIEGYGLTSPIVRIWGAFVAESQTLHGLLFRFANTIVVVDRAGECGVAFAQFIDGERGIAGVRGSEVTVRRVRRLLKTYQPSDWEDSFCLRLDRPVVCSPERLAFARRATRADLNKLAALYADAGVMYRSRTNLEAKLQNHRVFVVEEGPTLKRPSRIAACALINVENESAGLIGGVFTLPEARGRGYAAACTAALCRSLQEDGKYPVLFYENPIAGRVYRRLGFETTDRWAVLYLASPKPRR